MEHRPCEAPECIMIATRFMTKLRAESWDGSAEDWNARYLPPVAVCGMHGNTLTRNGWRTIWTL